MKRALISAISALSLGACEFDTSPEHARYCAEGGFFGCGHGTRLMMGALTGAAAGAAMSQVATPKPVPGALPVSCVTRRISPTTTQTTCE